MCSGGRSTQLIYLSKSTEGLSKDKETVHPKIKSAFFYLFVYSFKSFQCELPSFGDISCTDVHLLLNVMELEACNA